MDLTKLVIEDFQINSDFLLLSFETNVCDKTNVVMVDLVYRDEACFEHRLTTTLLSVISDEAKDRLSRKDGHVVIQDLISRLEYDECFLLTPEESIVILKNIDIDEAEEGMGEKNALGEEEKVIVKGSLNLLHPKPMHVFFIKLVFLNDGWYLSKD